MKKLLCLSLTIAVLSCNDEPVDIRDASIGTYYGNATFYVLRGNTLVQTGGVGASPIKVSKKESAADKLIIDFGDGDKVNGAHVQTSSAGLTFSLENFIDSHNFQFTGYPGYETDGSHYDGAFINDGSHLELWYQYTIHDTVKVTRCFMTRH